MPDLSEVSGKRQPMAHIWPLLAVGALGAALAMAAWVAVSAWEQRLAKVKFNDVAGDYATVLQHGLDQYFDKIRALRAFYDASVGVDRHEFTLFTSQILTGYGDTMRLLWLPRVGRDERSAIEFEARKNGLADFSITTWRPNGPVSLEREHQEYFPILYSTVSYAQHGDVRGRPEFRASPKPGDRPRARRTTSWRSRKTSNCATPSPENVRGFSPSCRSTNQVFPMTASSADGGTSSA